MRNVTISGFLWSTIEKSGQQVLHLIIGVLIARLLTPADYGLVGMIAIFLAISNAIIDGGFGQALIQKKNITSTDYSTVFVFNLIISLALYSSLFFLAPLISIFFQQDELTLIIRLTSVGLILNSLGIIQLSYLQRNLLFKTLAKVNIGSQACSGAIGLYLAYNGYGVYAIVAQSVLSPGFRTIFSLILTNFWVRIAFSIESFKSLFSFGGYLLAAYLLNVIFNNIYLLVIGKYYKITDVGYYSQGKRLQESISVTINQIIQRVLFPLFSSIQDEKKRIKEYTRTIFNVLGLVYIPVMILLIYIANPLITFLLTDKWQGAVIFFQILCLAGIVYPLNSVNTNILKSLGKTRLLFILDLIKKAFIIVAIVLSIKHGILILIWGKVISEFIGYSISKYYSGKEIDYSFLENIQDLGKYLIISIVAIGIVHLFISQNLGLNEIIGLLIVVSIYLFVYLGLNFLFNKKEIYIIINKFK